MEKVFKILKFFRLVDNDNLLSITNISVMVMVAKIAATQATSMQDMAMGVVALMSYMHKRQVNK